ncbi:DUF2207 domain-containing protein [Candidatus Saccharibacteria bacterium]|nr:DUF2207 domain-containing protein [Candidatus Saccharibacteria bacterium]
MKKLFLALILALTLTLFGDTAQTFASANDFYFTDATFDYYLEKLEDGRSKMHIEENLTAVFPSTNQNHGIERCIPKKYNNVSILPNPNFTVTRNGTSEPFTTYNDGGFLCLRIGNANVYVHNEQIYSISYDVENVVLNPTNATGQELYWDINGTGWSQKFESITARIHLPESLNLARKSQDTNHLSCYVGKYGTKGSAATSRCTIAADTSTDSKYPYTITFTAADLKPAEGLTVNIEFKSDTFFVKGPDPNYSLFIAIGVVTLISGFLIYKWVKAEQKIKEKKALAKDKVVPVQYTPPQGLTVAEAGTVWLKPERSLQVATLMQLAVQHDIELEKGEKKRFGGYHWKIHAKRVEDLKPEQKIVLEILNGGPTVHDGNTIEIKRHSSTSHLEKLGRDFPKKIESSLRGKQLFEPEKTSGLSGNVVTIVVAVFIILFAIAMPLLSVFIETINSLDESGATILFSVIAIFTISITATVAGSRISKYKKRTLEGIKTSKYLDGLKEYMELAEADRLKFLQSVKGADTSNQGIVKLWEKLLPYAVIFGIEDSWMEELNKYYQMDDVTNPYWLHGTTYFPVSDFHSFTSYTSSSISSSTASSSSGGSSGGGGGGFSGGGGGGGGGGGW